MPDRAAIRPGTAAARAATPAARERFAPAERALVELLVRAFDVPQAFRAAAELRRRDMIASGMHRVEGIALDHAGEILARGVTKLGLTRQAWDALPALEALRRDYQLPIPAIYAAKRRSRFVLMEWVDGLSLDLLVRAGCGRAPAERAGAAVAHLHSAPATDFHLLTLERLLGELNPAPVELPGQLGLRAAALASAIGALPDPITRSSGLCHRDLHPRQILDNGQRAIIVDLDQVDRGHPALDLANFSAYLTARIPEHAFAIEEAFLAGYAAAARSYLPGHDAQAESIYRAFTFLRLAVKAFRLGQAGWERAVDELLGLGQRSLDCAEAA